MITNCPGAKRFRHPEPEIVRCRSCSQEVEIWTDETSVKCPNCKKAVTRKQVPSCIEWCKYAKECVGARAYDKYMKDNKKPKIKNQRLKTNY